MLKARRTDWGENDILVPIVLVDSVLGMPEIPHQVWVYVVVQTGRVAVVPLTQLCRLIRANRHLLDLWGRRLTIQGEDCYSVFAHELREAGLVPDERHLPDIAWKVADPCYIQCPWADD